jgi:hypothetical protein
VQPFLLSCVIELDILRLGAQRAGHTQHRTVQDVDARMDDVWGGAALPASSSRVALASLATQVT